MRGERVNVGESRTLVRERRIRAEAVRGKDDSTVKEGRFKREKGRQAKKAHLGEVERSMSK